MKTIKTVEARIEAHKASIEKFKANNELEKGVKASLIFNIQILIDELYWVLK